MQTCPRPRAPPPTPPTPAGSSRAAACSSSSLGPRLSSWCPTRWWCATCSRCARVWCGALGRVQEPAACTHRAIPTLHSTICPFPLTHTRSRRGLQENAFNYDKGVLAEILEPIMGKGLIPADLETWKVRRRAIVPGALGCWARRHKCIRRLGTLGVSVPLWRLSSLASPACPLFVPPAPTSPPNPL